MTMQLAGHNAIITGASRGLGREIARALWRQGASLLLVARSGDTLTALQRELAAQKSASAQSAHILAVDLAAEQAAPRIAQEARSLWRDLHILVNNAGIQGPIGKTWENDWAEWTATIQVNLLAPVALCRACVPWMLERDGGAIVNLSGGGAASPRPRFSAYAAAKAALVRFSETLAQELSGTPLRVNCVAPGAMGTDMLQALLRAGPQACGAKEYAQAQKALQNSDTTLARAAALCLFLASPAGAGITGKLISAVWDPWEKLPERLDELEDSDIYTLRRVVPADRGKKWD